MQKALARTEGPAHEDGDLAAWRSQGWQHLEQGDVEAACRAFQRLIAAAVAEAAHWVGSEALDMVRQAASGLAQCLPALEADSAGRHDALQALFQVYRAGAEHDVDGVAKEIGFLLLRQASAPDRELLAHWARQALATSADDGPAEAYWRLLLDLAMFDPPTLEGLLAECRKAGHAIPVAERLLDLERVGEALIVARRELQDTGAFLCFASSPAAQGHVRAVMALVEERLAKAFDPRLADWLAARYAERGILQRALDLRVKLLRLAPGRGDYETARTLALRLGSWERLRPELIRLLQHSRREEALAEIALGEGDAEEALRYVNGAPERYAPGVVARLAEEAPPEQAAALYCHLIERALAAHEPGACREAARHLQRLHELCQRWGQLPAWESYFAELTREHGRRRGFPGELKRVGLAAECLQLDGAARRDGP